ncbi:MAG: hypothetical protein GX606_01060 [Elusimicrobia bacterium]|nr:hypothetical protein [Elusimicrobiota bacterium]
MPQRILVLILLLNLLAPTAMAQVPLEQLHFLENFGVRLYERGEILEAKQTFERLLTLDPANMKAAEYLQTIAGDPRPLPIETDSGLIEGIKVLLEDIALLRTDTLRASRESEEKTLLIRSLIAENDALYALMHKRTRELAQMHSAQGSLDANEEYLRLMAELPIERVPQHTHVPFTEGPIAAEGIDLQIKTLQAEITTYEQKIQNEGSPSAVDEDMLRELRTLLGNKRDLLVSQDILLARNNGTLRDMGEELTLANAALHRLAGPYAKTVADLDIMETHTRDLLRAQMSADLDRRIQVLDRMPEDREALIAKVSREQDPSLLKNTAQEAGPIADPNPANLGEIETLRQEVRRREETISLLEKKLAEGQSPLATVTAELVEKDRKIAALRAQVLSIQKELGDTTLLLSERTERVTKQDRIINDQKSALQNASLSLDAFAGSLDRLQAIADENSALLETARIRQERSARESAQLQTEVRDLRHNNLSLDERLSAAGRRIEEHDKESRLLFERLRRSEEALALSEDAAERLKLQITQLTEGSSNASAKPSTLDPVSAPQQASAVSRPADPRFSDEEILTLHQTLSVKDDALSALTLKTLQQNEENKQLLAMIQAYKAQLAQANALVQEQDRLKTHFIEETNMSLKQDVDTLRTTVVEMRDALTTRELDLKEQNSQNTALLKTLDAERSSLTQSDALLAETSQRLEALRIKQDAIDAVIAQRDETIATLSRRLADLQKDLLMAATEKDAALEKMRSIETAQKNSLEQLSASAEKIDSLARESADLREAVQTLQRSLLETERRMDRTLKEKISLEETLKDKDLQIQDIRTDLQESQADHKRTTEEMTTEMKKVRDELIRARKTMTGAEAEKERALAESTRLKRILEKKEAAAQAKKDSKSPEGTTQTDSGLTGRGCLIPCADQNKNPDATGCLIPCAKQ